MTALIHMRARFQVAVVLLAVVVAAAACAVGFSSAPQEASADKIAAQLYKGESIGAPLALIEERLGLGRPVDSRAPILYDPLWWFTYQKGDLLVEIAANDDEDGQPDLLDRSSFAFTGLFWIGSAKHARGHRVDLSGRASLTMQIKRHGQPEANGDIPTALGQVDMTNPPTIAELERRLGLPAPSGHELGAFLQPFITLTYSVDGARLRLAAINRERGVEGIPEDRSKLLFVGYWWYSQ